MRKPMIGIFESEELAISAIKRLKLDGYANEEISVLAKQNYDFDNMDVSRDLEAEHEDSKLVNKAATGGLLGGIGGLLIGFGAIAIPGIGPFLAAGPLAIALGGIVAGGAVGGVSGVLMEMGFDENDAKEYEGHLDKGHILTLVDEKDNRHLVYRNFYDNESLIRDRYERSKYNK